MTMEAKAIMAIKSAGTANVVLGLSERRITMRGENLVAVLCAMKDTVKLPEQKPAIAPSMPENATTIEIEAKVVA